MEDGQDVVAVAAGGLGDVDLHPEVEAEQPLGPLAVDAEVVEGGEQGRPGPPVAGLEALEQGQVVGVDVPGTGRLGAVGGQADPLDPARPLEAGQDGGQARVAAGGEVAVDVAGGGDPEGAEAALGGQPDDLALGRAAGRGPRRKPALGQVPDPLLALAAGDHDAALGPEDVEHAVDVAARRPAARPPGGAGPGPRGPGSGAGRRPGAGAGSSGAAAWFSASQDRSRRL